MNKPDSWVILKITSKDVIYKVFATWKGGYLDGDSWRMNSGISEVIETKKYYDFRGYSGSSYICVKGRYGASGYTKSVLDSIIKDGLKRGVKVEIMDKETNFKDLLKWKSR